jgi:plasmid segregation protein ParM
MTDIYAAFDIGYAYTKLYAGEDIKVRFPSVVGTPDWARFSLNDAAVVAVTVGDVEYFVGDSAIIGSQFSERSEDRDWISTPEYMALFHAALSLVAGMSSATMYLVTGLPIAYYRKDKDALEQTLTGEHVVRRTGRTPQTIVVEKALVIPQGMGVAIDAALTMEALVGDTLIAEGDVGVIDIGGKTTNFQRVHQMADVAPETASIALGGWDAVRAMSGIIEEVAPGGKYEDHEVSAALANRSIRYKGKTVLIEEEVYKTIVPMAGSIAAKANQLWSGGAKLDAIVIAGGGASLLGEMVSAELDHGEIRIVEDPMYSNARGYYKLALRAQLKGL